MGNVDLTMLNVKHGYNLQLAHKAHNQEILPNACYLVRAQDDEEGLYVSWAGVPSTTDPSAWAVEPAFFEFESLFLSLNPDVSTSINGRMLRQTAGCLRSSSAPQGARGFSEVWCVGIKNAFLVGAGVDDAAGVAVEPSANGKGAAKQMYDCPCAKSSWCDVSGCECQCLFCSDAAVFACPHAEQCEGEFGAA